MPNSNAFVPVVDDTGTQNCVQATTATASASLQIVGNEILVTALTQPCYIRLGNSSSAAVSATNGYYMAVGKEIRWQISNNANKLFYIRSGGDDGAISVAFGTGD
jgi:hypothetical protein